MSELAQVLRHLIPIENENALVDASTGDDAAVYALGDGRALVVTIDFFTPLVDDPYDFGRIAAANALSDIYAMGAQPLFVLNLLAFPRALLGDGLVDEIIRGGSDTAREAGVPIMGGHSVDDPEPKYGMVAVGEVNVEELVTNASAEAGDLLVLTKAHRHWSGGHRDQGRGSLRNGDCGSGEEHDCPQSRGGSSHEARRGPGGDGRDRVRALRSPQHSAAPVRGGR